jgi:trimeric autotransporter adhesin
MKYIVLILVFSVSYYARTQIFIPFGFYACQKGKAYQEDSLSTDFSAGTFNNTMTSGNSVVLGVGQTSGTFTSQVFNINCITQWSWTSLLWKSTLPYEKELTSTSEATQEYSAISNTLMNNLLVYYNFNETAANTATSGNDFEDRSGNSRHATETNLSAYGATGKLINAVTLNGTSSRINLPNTVASTAKNYTFAMWFRTTASANNLTYLFDTLDGANRIIIAPTCSSALCSTQGRIAVCTGSCASLTSSTIASPTDGNWHHLVVTMDTTSQNVVIYLDYSTTYTYTGTYGATGVNINGTNIKIGSRYAGDNWFFNGDIDEYAIWTRALSSAEILQLYRRGANRLRFQVRSCTSATCADNPAFLGPDGTSATFFSELYNNSSQLNRNGNPLVSTALMMFSNFTSLNIPSNQYFQYRATLQTDNVTYSPDITTVRVTR